MSAMSARTPATSETTVTVGDVVGVRGVRGDRRDAHPCVQIGVQVVEVDTSGTVDVAAERRRLEAAMPPDLRYVKGWPPRIPTIEEAGIIAASSA